MSARPFMRHWNRRKPIDARYEAPAPAPTPLALERERKLFAELAEADKAAEDAANRQREMELIDELEVLKRELIGEDQMHITVTPSVTGDTKYSGTHTKRTATVYPLDSTWRLVAYNTAGNVEFTDPTLTRDEAVDAARDWVTDDNLFKQRRHDKLIEDMQDALRYAEAKDYGLAEVAADDALQRIRQCLGIA